VHYCFQTGETIVDIQLTDIEVRVVASLVEKENTTPEYYPMSLNALKNACNQKSSRDPVVHYDEKTVLRALESLREKNLVLMVTGMGSRVAKYKHTFARRFQLNQAETAVLCILMLRGPQTVGEIRGRSSRIHQFTDLLEVSDTLDGLMKRGEGAYVAVLPRQPGRKEVRFAHLLAGDIDVSPEHDESSAPVIEVNQAPDELERLREEIDGLRQELQSLRALFEEFKQQFE
jgi:uncharacterized protein YceH (UPF0502 family)